MNFAPLIASAALIACSSLPPPVAERRASSERISAPVEWVKGLPVTSIQLAHRDGRPRPTKVVLDLGSGLPLTLTADVLAWAERAPAAAEGERQFSNIRGDLLTARWTTLDRMQFAGVSLRGVQTTEAVWHPGYEPPVKLGVIGWPVFAGQRVEFDLANGRVWTQPTVPNAPCTHPIEVDSNGVEVSLRTASGSVTAVLDTAATHTFVTRSELMKAPIALGRPLKLGERHLFAGPSGPAAPFSDVPEVILGAPFFRNHRVVIDFSRGCIAVDPD